ncbi:hypothetical protein EDD76_102257 [Kineothrix alysoides]|uniref:Uncharacterized protein n=1 Tax=Kineothrix alysoides TaxID=1469948 RepID=A0A4R1R506_9FIRM|nr:hypothetical protein [Kineothrix alysoides]TCL60559.1 hypothetical protein EDD76_102257 [Kineothrix alysoides]
MAAMDYDYFVKQLNSGISVDEIRFEIIGDTEYNDCYIGYQSPYEKPYWAGLCDIKDGCEFRTAKELVNAKIYRGKSIKELWDRIELITLAGVCLEDWLKYFLHADLS